MGPGDELENAESDSDVSMTASDSDNASESNEQESNEIESPDEGIKRMSLVLLYF